MGIMNDHDPVETQEWVDCAARGHAACRARSVRGICSASCATRR